MIRPDAPQHHAEAGHVEESGCRILPRGAQQQVVGLVATQHVVDQFGRDRDLPPGLLLPRKPPLDQPGDDRALAEGALHHGGFVEPGFEVVAEHVLVEQRLHEVRREGDALAHVLRHPDGDA